MPKPIKTLFDIVNYQSGDSWNGTHDRSIRVVFNSLQDIEVGNEYSGHSVKGSFTYEELAGQIAGARNARYFSDFCYEVQQNIPFAKVVRDAGSSWYFNDVTLAATQQEIDTVCRQGTVAPVTVHRKPLKLKV